MGMGIIWSSDRSIDASVSIDYLDEPHGQENLTILQDLIIMNGGEFVFIFV
jgi:hypothetical protein